METLSDRLAGCPIPTPRNQHQEGAPSRHRPPITSSVVFSAQAGPQATWDALPFGARAAMLCRIGTTSNVITHETATPPITARARGSLASAPSPNPTAMGSRPKHVANAVTRTGRRRKRQRRGETSNGRAHAVEFPFHHHRHVLGQRHTGQSVLDTPGHGPEVIASHAKHHIHSALQVVMINRLWAGFPLHRHHILEQDR